MRRSSVTSPKVTTPLLVAINGIDMRSCVLSMTLGILTEKLPLPVSTAPAAISRLFLATACINCSLLTPYASSWAGFTTASSSSSRSPLILASRISGSPSSSSLSSLANLYSVRSGTLSPPSVMVIIGKSETDTSRTMGSSAVVGILTLAVSTASRTSMTA